MVAEAERPATEVLALVDTNGDGRWPYWIATEASSVKKDKREE
jgi:hypothetical protein